MPASRAWDPLGERTGKESWEVGVTALCSLRSQISLGSGHVCGVGIITECVGESREHRSQVRGVRACVRVRGDPVAARRIGGTGCKAVGNCISHLLYYKETLQGALPPRTPEPSDSRLLSLRAAQHSAHADTGPGTLCAQSTRTHPKHPHRA